MNSPADWTVSPYPARWDLLFNFDDLSGSRCWYRLTNLGDVTVMPFAEGAIYCVTSSGGARASLTGPSSFYEGTYGLWTILRSVVDLRSDFATPIKIAINGNPAWSNDERKFAYCRTTEAWSNDEGGLVSCREDGGDFLAVHDLNSGSTREIRTQGIRCLRWRPDDREIVAVVGDRDALRAVTFVTDDLTQVAESVLPIEPTAQGFGFSPDAAYLSFCDYPSGDDSPDDAPYTGYIYGSADKRIVPIGPQCLYTRPVWSPTGRWLAYHGQRDAGWNSDQVLAITDPTVQETVDIAVVNSGDLSGDITGPDPSWSADGGLLAFFSYEGDGGAIHITDIASKTCTRVLQTRGLVHSLGFVMA